MTMMKLLLFKNICLKYFASFVIEFLGGQFLALLEMKEIDFIHVYVLKGNKAK